MVFDFGRWAKYSGMQASIAFAKNRFKKEEADS